MSTRFVNRTWPAYLIAQSADGRKTGQLKHLFHANSSANFGKINTWHQRWAEKRNPYRESLGTWPRNDLASRTLQSEAPFFDVTQDPVRQAGPYVLSPTRHTKNSMYCGVHKSSAASPTISTTGPSSVASASLSTAMNSASKIMLAAAVRSCSV
jgi:hypothetical protein